MAFVLNQLATSGPMTESAIGEAVPGAIKSRLKLNKRAIGPLLKGLTEDGLIGPGPASVFPTFVITAAGRDRLQEWADFVPRPPVKKSLAEQTIEKVRAKVAGFGDKPVSLKPPGGKNVNPEAVAAFEQAVRELVADGKLFEHPGGKYGKHPVPTLADVVRQEVQDKLDTAAGPFKPADLSKPKRGASDDDKAKHADTLGKVIAELVEAKKLFPHPGGKYGQLPAKSLADEIREQAAEKLAELNGPFELEDLSRPKDGAKKGEKKAHADALATVVAELVAEQKLLPHPGGRYAKQPFVYPDRELREVYVLDIFRRAPSHTIAKADIELAFPGKGKPEKKELEARHPHVARFRGQGCFEMGAPATRQTLERLAESSDLRADAGGEAYTLTDAGAKRLEQARAKFPVLPPVGDPATPDDAAMRGKWEAVVLLRLTEAADFTGSESVVFAGGYPKGSKLNEATAWVLYGELAKAGHVVPRWNGTEGEYTLTPKGLRHLAGLSFDGFPEVKIKGTALTALLSAARGGEKAATAPTPTSPPPADLEAAVMDIFHRLLRERHANIRMVPIHEVRSEVRAKFGDRAASHEVFDELLLDLRRVKKLRMVSSNDLTRATEQQIQDSVFAVGETFFYLGVAHAPVSS
jgi:DNA-binding PadR family transcriptional regulator